MTEPWDSERRIVESTREPITKKRLMRDLRNAGVRSGDILLVHSSMKSIGWTVGGAVTVIEALMETITEDGTLVMPTQSTDNGDPSRWQAPAVPQAWWDTIKNEMPPYNPVITPTRMIGVVPETFRKYPHVYRSAHPQASFGAWGKRGQYVVASHPVDDVFGENSPLGKLYELHAKILLIGIGYNANTSLHYAEYRAKLPNMPRVTMGAAVLVDGKRTWTTWEELDYNDSDFPQIAREYEKKSGQSAIYIGQAESHIFPMRELVDFAVGWLRKNRHYTENESV